MIAPEVNIYKVPLDVLVKQVFRYFTIFELFRLASVNRLFAKIARHRLLWQEKFRSHFDHLSPFLQIDPNTDWRLLFIKTCTEQYTPKQTRVFLIAQEGDIAEYKKRIKQKNIEVDNFVHFSDKMKRKPIGSIISLGNQQFLNTIFGDACNRYFGYAGTSHPLLRDSHGWSAAHWATACNQANEAISQHLAGINLDQFAVTPLHLAAEFGLESKVNFFLNELNYHPSARTNTTVLAAQSLPCTIRETALHLAASAGQYKVVANFLKNPRINIHDTVEVILHDGPYNTVVNSGIKALHCAARNNHTKTVALFLQSRLSPLECDLYGNFALLYAVTFRNSKMFEDCMRALPAELKTDDILLLNRSLFLAVIRQQIDFIRELLLRGANPHWLSANDDPVPKRTAIDLAVDQRNEEILRLLLTSQENFSNGLYRPQRISGMLSFIGLALGFIVSVISAITLVFVSNPSLKFFIFLLLLGPISGAVVGFLLAKYLEYKSTRNATNYLQDIANSNNDQRTEELDLEIGRRSDDATARSCSPFGFFNTKKVDLYKKTDEVRLGSVVGQI